LYQGGKPRDDPGELVRVAIRPPEMLACPELSEGRMSPTHAQRSRIIQWSLTPEFQGLALPSSPCPGLTLATELPRFTSDETCD